jgi:hypothetical protein
VVLQRTAGQLGSGRVGPRDAERLDLRVVHARGRERGELVEVVKGGPAQLQLWRVQPEAR